MNYLNLREEALKNAVREDFFSDYSCTVLGNIDFVVVLPQGVPEYSSVLWAEAKKGKSDVIKSFVQLILTIGNQKDKGYMPPPYIGAFDGEKFAFIEYYNIQEVFNRNDFNWNVAPSNHETPEFKRLYELCKKTLEENKTLYYYDTDSKELKKFIKKLEKGGGGKINITKNNFPAVFQKWLAKVKDTIAIDWEAAKKTGIISADFFLADLLSENNNSLKDNLFVVLKNTKYELAKTIDESGIFTVKEVGFKDDQKAHREFWAIYKRPPKSEYWDYIIGRRDLLVPQDIRERKGSFFTPKIWVEKSQEYLSDVLGENWQDEYYIWDCCAGTGNLLNGLTNYRNVWASTLDKADVDVMVDRVNNGWNMFENHIFQFDFLNDDFDKLPEELRKIVNDEEKRKKLVIYINPPYAEADNRKGTGRNSVAISKIQEKYKTEMGYTKRELFIQFMVRIDKELQRCKLGQFAKLKALCASNFGQIRRSFQAKLEKIFLVPADTFDNVKGEFPIAFHIWDTGKREPFAEILADVFDSKGESLPQKLLVNYDGKQFINDWTLTFIDDSVPISIGTIIGIANDFQNQRTVRIEKPFKPWNHQYQWQINTNNLIQSCIYLSARQCIPATWLNDRDQFLYPNDGWKEDREFQANCLAFTMFHSQNKISAEHGENHWIPFTEQEIGCKKAFKSHFMSDFIAGKIEHKKGEQMSFSETLELPWKDVFSDEAKAVFNAGRELWKYYHSQKNANPDASFYDIRKYFQGETNGRMNASSEDEKYTALISDLRAKMKVLAAKIAEKVYKYGFLK